MLEKDPNLRNNAEELLSMEVFREFHKREDVSEFDKLERWEKLKIDS